MTTRAWRQRQELDNNDKSSTTTTRAQRRRQEFNDNDRSSTTKARAWRRRQRLKDDEERSTTTTAKGGWQQRGGRTARMQGETTASVRREGSGRPQKCVAIRDTTKVVSQSRSFSLYNSTADQFRPPLIFDTRQLTAIHCQQSTSHDDQANYDTA
jgi:hypothetical protein